MPPRKTASTTTRNAAARSDDSSVTGIVVVTAITLVAALLLGGYWLQKQRTEIVHQHRQAQMYDSYRDYTRPTPSTAEAATALPAAYIEAQRTREKLLNHPAVTPGPGFNQRGVQSTGVAIIDAIDQAKQTAQ